MRVFHVQGDQFTELPGLHSWVRGVWSAQLGQPGPRQVKVWQARPSALVQCQLPQRVQVPTLGAGWKVALGSGDWAWTAESVEVSGVQVSGIRVAMSAAIRLTVRAKRVKRVTWAWLTWTRVMLRELQG